MKTHTIIGATGFIGSYVAQQLVQTGVALTAVVRSSSDTHFLQELGVTIVRLDEFDTETLGRAFTDSDVVYNCTANVHIHQSLLQYRDVQVNLTRNIVEAAANTGVKRLVQLSTVEVYGQTPNEFIDETYATKPLFDLQTSMLEREQLLNEMATHTDMEIVILRPAGTIGRRSPLLDMLVTSHKKGKFPMIGDGDVTFSMVDTRDIGRAMVFLGHSTTASGQTYLLKGYETTMQAIKTAFDQYRSQESKLQKMPVLFGKIVAKLMVTFTPYGKTPMLTPFVIKNQTTPILINDQKLRNLNFAAKYSFNDSIANVLADVDKIDEAFTRPLTV